MGEKTVEFVFDCLGCLKFGLLCSRLFQVVLKSAQTVSVLGCFQVLLGCFTLWKFVLGCVRLFLVVFQCLWMFCLFSLDVVLGCSFCVNFLFMLLMLFMLCSGLRNCF